MRIARFSSAGHDPRYGLVELAADHGEHPDTITVLDRDPLSGPVNATGERISLDEARLLAPVIPRSKVVGLAYNYPGAQDNGVEVFFKPNTAVIGPDDPIVMPQLATVLQTEAELAIVIGRICRHVPTERASEVIFGYTCANDVAASELQSVEQQWARAKGFDTFAPLGPWIVTHLSVDEAQDLMVASLIDNEQTGRGKTSRMLMSIPQIVAYVSAFTTLLPGDVIMTGAPAGAATATAGQSVTVDIDQIGTLTNQVVAEQ